MRVSTRRAATPQRASCVKVPCATRFLARAVPAHASTRPRHRYAAPRRTAPATLPKHVPGRRRRALRTRHSPMGSHAAPTDSHAPMGFARASPSSARPLVRALACSRRAPRASRIAKSRARIPRTPSSASCLILSLLSVAHVALVGRAIRAAIVRLGRSWILRSCVHFLSS